MSSTKSPKRRHLGRGLESLLRTTIETLEEKTIAPEVPSGANFPPDKDLARISNVPISQIRPNPYQPRTTWDDEELNGLAESIRVNGVIQPILVRRDTDHYELIAGERRLRASELAGLDKVPALVRDASDSEMLELALVENIHRTDLNPIERAFAYRNYIDSFSLSQTDAAKRLGEDRSVVANYLRLLDLPQELKDMLTGGKLSMGHARAILALPTDELRRKLANRALAGRLSVREVERLVRRQLQKPVEAAVKPEKAAHIADLEEQLRSVLGTKVNIETRKNGRRGRIVIEFYSLDEFDRLTERMGLAGAESA